MTKIKKEREYCTLYGSTTITELNATIANIKDKHPNVTDDDISFEIREEYGSHYIFLFYHELETDAEYKKRLERNEIEQRRIENMERFQFERLRKKYGGKNER